MYGLGLQQRKSWMELAQDLSYWLCFKIENSVIRECIIHLDEYLLLGKGGR
jgi:hypothetical protein